MVGITGIGGVNELHGVRPARTSRDLPVGDRPETTGTDALSISEAAKDAAEVARYVRESAKESEIREAQVEAAKQRLNEGRQRVEEVLNEVAEALLNYL
ncbi:MAG: flagellar biosynthesis anti-sigma factor FlgM [Candidatus Hydrogenedentes bacterium]|nr:flagellar biosynthesis anti-sigma factor FlgM [Candidatus Hydrogenedentota bacterium]